MDIPSNDHQSRDTSDLISPFVERQKEEKALYLEPEYTDEMVDSNPCGYVFVD